MALHPSMTLLELVTAVSRVAASEEEVVATVIQLVNSGRVALCGTFRGSCFRVEDVA